MERGGKEGDHGREDTEEGTEEYVPAENGGQGMPCKQTFPVASTNHKDAVRMNVDKETKDNDDVAMASRVWGCRADETEQPTVDDKMVDIEIDYDKVKVTTERKNLTTARFFGNRHRKKEKGANTENSRRKGAMKKRPQRQEEQMNKPSKIVACIFACCCVQPSE
ncbi:uncharacterized protein LOC110990725 [Acanthaster planci]|uniref:Uncharacterized protein LOC110990725 n=1 Tax=Acanthaster planci TaxID=133434 RepID=A0A8B8A192_ACAPL|nr:uncharacterized protein LOC110990725 [Acanthaster planci]